MAITFRGNPTAPRKEWPNRATSLIVAIPSLLLTTLAPILDQVRAPVLSVREAKPQVLADTSQGQSPLLKAVEAPFVPAPHLAPLRVSWTADTSLGTSASLKTVVVAGTNVLRPPTIQQAKSRPEVRADTWRGSPLPLVSVIAAPFVPAPHYAPHRVWWQPSDESSGTPKTAFADSAAPIFNAPNYRVPRLEQVHAVVNTAAGTPALLLAVELPPGQTAFVGLQRVKWVPADTSQDLQKVAFGDSVAPLVPAPHASPVKPQWQPADTSADTPKPAFSDAQAPVVNAPQFLAHPVRNVADTSDATPVELFAIALPPGQASFVGLQRAWWQPADTSASVPKPAYSDAQAPVFDAPQSQVVRPPQVADTSQGGILDLVVAPFVQASHIGPQRFPWAPGDTSRGVAKVAVADAIAPFVPPPHLQQQYLAPWLADTSQGQSAVLKPIAPFVPAPHIGPLKFPWLPADTSDGLAKVAFGDAIAAITPPVHLPSLYRAPLTTDTSQSQSPLLKPAPFVPPAHFVPLRFWWQPADTSASVPKPTYSDKQSPTFVAPWLQVVRPPQVADTSQSSALVDTIAPFVPAQYFATPRYPWLPANTSASSGKVTYRDAVPAIVPPPHLAPQRYPSLPADTSHGIAKVAFGDAVPAFVALPYFAPQRYPSLPADTSHGDSVLLQAPTQNDLVGDVGVLALTGIAGSIGQSVNLAGDVGALVLTGQAGSVDRQDNQLLAGSVGTLTLSGVAGAVQQSDNLAGDSGQLLLTGIAGSIQQNTTLAGDVGTLVLTGQAGTVDRQDNQFLDGVVGTLVLTGQAGAVGQSVNLDGAIGGLSLAGVAGSVNQSVNLVGSVGALSLSGIAGEVDRTDRQFLVGDVGVLTLTGVAGAVDVSTGTGLVGDVGQLVLTGIAGAIDQTQNQLLAGAVGSFSLTGIAGSIPSAGQDVIVGPSRPPFFVEPIRLRLVLATIRTSQAQTVRGHGFVDVRAQIRTAQASQSVRADASARVKAEANTSQINRSEAFGDARIRVSIVSQQSTGIYELAANALVLGEITSGLFAADTPPEYDGPEDDDILPDLTRKVT